jgi:hypothetical protein
MPFTRRMVRHVRFEAHAAQLYESLVGSFRISRGKEIVVDPRVGAEEALVQVLLLGTAFALLLHQRGYLVLRASAVVMDGQAVLLIGGSGTGKSAVAAALCARGARLLADDVVAVDCRRQGPPAVLPGFPLFRLLPSASPDAGEMDAPPAPWALEPGVPHEQLNAPHAHPQDLTVHAVTTPAPLARCYCLARGHVTQLTELRPPEAFIQLIGSSYTARFGPQLLDRGAAVTLLEQCFRLVQHVPVHQLQRPMHRLSVSATARQLEQHLRRVAPGGALAALLDEPTPAGIAGAGEHAPAWRATVAAGG